MDDRLLREGGRLLAPRVSNPDRAARWLWEAAPEPKTFLERVERVRQGEPLQYVLGSVDFLDMNLAVGPGVLIPRPETEGWVTRLLERWRKVPHQKPARALELGTGCGNIALALAAENIRVIAVEQSDAALPWAQRNGRIYDSHQRVTWIAADWTVALADLGFRQAAAPVDTIVSNPPYISHDALRDLPAEVRMEPAQALDGGADGLVAYRFIARILPAWLKPGGWVALEIGDTQRKAVTEILESGGIDSIECWQDLAGRDRAIFGIYNG